MNCFGLLPAGMVLAVVSTVPPARRRRFTMASPIPLVPPVTRIRLPVNSFASYGKLDALMVLRKIPQFPERDVIARALRGCAADAGVVEHIDLEQFPGPNQIASYLDV